MARLHTSKVTKSNKSSVALPQEKTKSKQKDRDLGALVNVSSKGKKRDAVGEGLVSTSGLSIEDVIALGGDEKDYEDLKDLDSDVEFQSNDLQDDVRSLIYSRR